MQHESKPSSGKIWLAAIPAVFVFLWSTGFIGAKFGLPYAEPGIFLAIRHSIVAAVMIAVAVLFRAPWPKSWPAVVHLATIGILLHAIYLGGVFFSISLGVDAGVSALITGLQPVIVVILAGPLLGERQTRRQWFGFALGLIGVVLVVQNKLDLGAGTVFGMTLSVVALLGMALGTLYQKRFGQEMDLRSGSAIQFTAAAIVMWLVSWAFEDMLVSWTGEFIFAMFWLCVVLSFGAVSLLYLMIRKGAASKVSSLLFMVPPTAAIIAYFMFGETLSPVALVGMAIAVIGVALVNFGNT
jgi:drug/metabolite transporter (DMT)-like permease